MNKKLTDFEETKDLVIQYHREVRHKPLKFKVKEDSNMALHDFL